MRRTHPQRRQIAARCTGAIAGLALLIVILPWSIHTRSVSPTETEVSHRFGALTYLVLRRTTAGPAGPEVARSWEWNLTRLAVSALIVSGITIGTGTVGRLLADGLRLPPDQCDACGYRLGPSGSARCPECGAPATAPDHAPGRWLRGLATIVRAAALMLAISAAIVLVVALWRPTITMRAFIEERPHREAVRYGMLGWRTIDRTWADPSVTTPAETVTRSPTRLAATIGITVLLAGALTAPIVRRWLRRRGLLAVTP
ncbi:MAG: hypothetical protein KF817_04645 [Phycisphaeraceae bacterium]|nr:hypothetical protein [Phycisphaeraceae bacterium]